jgi:hypothetical protein
VEIGPVNGDFEVLGDHEFAVASFQLGAQIVDPGVPTQQQKGDPAQSFMTTVEQYRIKYVFLAPTDYLVSVVDVVIPMTASLTLDGAPVTVPLLPLSSGYGVARIPLGPGAANGAHVMEGSEPFGIQVIGYGKYTSYQYPGGLNLGKIAPVPVKLG